MCVAANHKNPKPAAVVKHEEALPVQVPPLSLDEVKEMTDNFGSKALIGEGSYGRVYYATLNDGVPVALKKLDVAPESEPDPEFLSQVQLSILDYISFNSLYINTLLFLRFPWCLD